MKYLKFIILFLIVLVVAVVFVRSRAVVVRVDDRVYKKGERMQVFLKNRFWDKEVCLSSCHPYFLEKKNGDWSRYRYVDCPSEDRVSICLSPREERSFETSVPSAGSGVHRISIPVCENCNLGTVFYEEDVFISEEFEVK